VQIGEKNEFLRGAMTMNSAQHCLDQAAECRRLMQSATDSAEADVLKNLSQSWSRLAGQIDRYQALKRDQARAAGRKDHQKTTRPDPHLLIRCDRSGA
jgi:hypothetical protein